jgi:hypothetical protein
MKFSTLVIGIVAVAAGSYAAPAPNANPVDAALLISRSELCGFAKTLKTRDEIMKRNPACKRSPVETVDDGYDSLPCAWTLKQARDEIMEREPACKRSPVETVDDGYDSLPCAWTLKKSRRDEILERVPLVWSELKMSRRDLNVFADELERRVAEC